MIDSSQQTNATGLCVLFVKGISAWIIVMLVIVLYYSYKINLCLAPSLRFRFVESLAPPAKDSLRSSFASDGLLTPSALALRARFLGQLPRLESSLWLWQRLEYVKSCYMWTKLAWHVFSLLYNRSLNSYQKHVGHISRTQNKRYRSYLCFCINPCWKIATMGPYDTIVLSMCRRG